MRRSTIARTALGVLLSCVAVACGPDQPAPRIICHNANCVEPVDPDQDDTIATLTASLALQDDQGKPLIDGVELDTFWYGEQERCLFAHDLNNLESATDAMAPVTLLNAHLAQRAQAQQTRSGQDFSIFIELKGHVGALKTEQHTSAQLAAHASCALSLASALADGALARGQHVEVVFTSFVASLLEALTQDPAWGGLQGRAELSVKLGILLGIPKPLDSQSQPLDRVPATLPLDMVSAHPHWLRRDTLGAIQSQGWALSLWMFNAVPETYDAIWRYQPPYITTSEARTLAGWLDQSWD